MMSRYLLMDKFHFKHNPRKVFCSRVDTQHLDADSHESGTVSAELHRQARQMLVSPQAEHVLNHFAQ